MQLTWRLSRAQSSPALGTASKRCVARPADPARPHSPLSTAHACPPRHAQTCNFDVLYACASARLEPARLPWPARELHRSPVTHALRAGTSRPPTTTSRTIAQRTCAHSRRQTLSVCTHCCTCTNSCTHPRSPRRPKRNIKTAMNHEILLYGIAQKVCGRATTNHVYSYPDIHSHLSLAAFQEQLGFDKAVEVRP